MSQAKLLELIINNRLKTDEEFEEILKEFINKTHISNVSKIVMLKLEDYKMSNKKYLILAKYFNIVYEYLSIPSFDKHCTIPLKTLFSYVTDKRGIYRVIVRFLLINRDIEYIKQFMNESKCVINYDELYELFLKQRTCTQLMYKRVHEFFVNSKIDMCKYTDLIVKDIITQNHTVTDFRELGVVFTEKQQEIMNEYGVYVLKDDSLYKEIIAMRCNYYTIMKIFRENEYYIPHSRIYHDSMLDLRGEEKLYKQLRKKGVVLNKATYNRFGVSGFGMNHSVGIEIKQYIEENVVIKPNDVPNIDFILPRCAITKTYNDADIIVPNKILMEILLMKNEPMTFKQIKDNYKSLINATPYKNTNKCVHFGAIKYINIEDLENIYKDGYDGMYVDDFIDYILSIYT